jgi:hypothetical protein
MRNLLEMGDEKYEKTHGNYFWYYF